MVDRLLADLADDPHPDLVARFNQPLPIQVIAELLGVPEDRWDWVAATSDVLADVFDPFVPLDPATVDATCDDLVDSIGDLAEQRLTDPRDDLITDLARAEHEGARLDRIELVAVVAMLMAAGHVTTTGALGNAMIALAQHPDQRRLVRGRPELWPNAVEELLRFDTALQTGPRAALEDTQIGGHTIRKGQNLTIMIGAVNRDPRRFDNPNDLRLDRHDPAPLSFGQGIHHCLGAGLARMEMRIGLQAFTED